MEHHVQSSSKVYPSVSDARQASKESRQNPIKWLHFMSKSKFNDSVRSTGITHCEAPLSAALDALKGRIIRLYSDAAKVIYGEGPYCLSQEYSKF